MFTRLFHLTFIYLISGPGLAYADQLILGTTTSTMSSGLLDQLIPAFEKKHGHKIKLYSVGTGKALRMGRQGRVDVLLVHAPEAELEFVADGHGILRTPIMKNAFIIAGPASDPAGIHGLQDAKQALTRIKASQSLFISRADDSGTHKKEIAIWKACNIQPYGDWYYELGAAMGETVRTADSQQGYALVDKSSWLAMRNSLKLELHVEGDPALDNPYSLIAVNPERHPKVNIRAAKEFINWMKGTQGQAIVRGLQIDNEYLYTVIAK